MQTSLMNVPKVQPDGKICLNYRMEVTSFRKASQTAEVLLNPRLSHKMFQIFVVIMAETLKRRLVDVTHIKLQGSCIIFTSPSL